MVLSRRPHFIICGVSFLFVPRFDMILVRCFEKVFACKYTENLANEHLSCRVFSFPPASFPSFYSSLASRHPFVKCPSDVKNPKLVMCAVFFFVPLQRSQMNMSTGGCADLPYRRPLLLLGKKRYETWNDSAAASHDDGCAGADGTLGRFPGTL